MTQLKELEKTFNEFEEPLKKAFLQIHQVLCWLYEWLENIEESISKEK